MKRERLLIALSVCGLIAAPAFSQINTFAANGLPPTSNGVSGTGMLPPTRMDSFVYESGGAAELIYGDEVVQGIPPFFGFTAPHRINSGIFAVRDQGLTTGHGSWMPDAWGRDEFLGQEWSMSGAGGGLSGAGGFPAAGGAPDGGSGGPLPSGFPGGKKISSPPGVTTWQQNNTKTAEWVLPGNYTTLPKNIDRSPDQGKSDLTGDAPNVAGAASSNGLPVRQRSSKVSFETAGSGF